MTSLDSDGSPAVIWGRECLFPEAFSGEIRWYRVVDALCLYTGLFFFGGIMLEKFLTRTQYFDYDDFKANYALDYPEDFNFATHVVDAYAAESPDKRALVWCDDNGNERTFSFAEISDLSQRTAAYLVSNGVVKGSRVLLIMKRRWEYWVTVLALHRIGAVAIPASYQLTAHDLTYRIDAAKVSTVIVTNDEWILPQATEACNACPSVRLRLCANGAPKGWLDLTEAINAQKGHFAVDKSLKADDLMIMYFTSGTSGMPKMVAHNHTYPLGHIATAYWQCVQDDGLHFTGADSGWAKFGWGAIYGQWIHGSAILGYDQDKKFNARNLIEVIKKYQPTSFCVPGTIYRFLLKEGLTAKDFASVKTCATAGEPLAPSVVQEFQSVTGLTIREGYGQSEGSVLIGNYAFFAPVAGSCGKPSPNVDLKIVNSEGKRCALGDVGEIVIEHVDVKHPEGLLVGYWKDGQLTRAYDQNGTYHTGDYGWMDEYGYVRLIGRNDDMIKCSGYRIGPYEIESVLIKHPAIHECAITGEPDPLRGQIICATVSLNKGYSPSDALTKELQDYVKFNTAPYKYPRKVIYAKSLPKTTSGKIIRKAIRDKEFEELTY